MNKTFSKFNNKEESKANANTSIVNQRDEASKNYYENKRNNLRSLSPITYKRNEHVESHKILVTKFEGNISGNINNQDPNMSMSYFEEFNVKYLFLFEILKLFYFYL